MTEPAEDLNWVESPLTAGDEIRVRLTEASLADPPKHRERADPGEDERRKKNYVLRLAKEFKWKIQM